MCTFGKRTSTCRQFSKVTGPSDENKPPTAKQESKVSTFRVYNPSIRPNETNRGYYPTKTDIKNHVYPAKHAQGLSKLDEDNLRLQIEHWKKENPSTMFCYRPWK